MITLIHGDNIAASRNYYFSEREKTTEKKIIDGATIAYTDLLQIFSGNGLFGDSQTIFIEELLSKRKSSKEIETFATFLSEQTDTPIILWESKLLTPKQLSLFKKAVIKECKIPTVVFTFLDSLKPTNAPQTLKLYHEILLQEDASYVLFMLQRHVRLLLSVLEAAQPTISEVSRMAPWQLTKLQKQAKMFTQEKLLDLHQDLFQMDLDQKTGNLPTPLSQRIDFFLCCI